jgi:hypothetical protein
VDPSEARLLRLDPTAPIEAQVRADGPLRALMVQGRATLEGAQLAVHGRVDVPARSGRVQAVARGVRLARLLRTAPAMTVSGDVAVAGHLQRHALVGDVEFANGDVLVNGRRVSALTGDAQVSLARSGRITFHRVSGRWQARAVAARGQLEWSGGQITLTDAEVTTPEARARGNARYELPDHRLSVRAEPVSLSPALVARLIRHRPAAPWSGRVDLDGTLGDLALAIEMATPVGPLHATAHILGTGEPFDLSRVEAHIGDSHLVGAVHYQAGRFHASLDEAVLSPSLVHQLAPELTPAWPLHLRGAFEGHRPSFEVTVALDAGPSTATMHGRVDGRQFRLVGHLDSFDPAVLRQTGKRVRGTLNLAANGRFENGGAVGTLSIRDGRGYMMDSPYYRGIVDAKLEGRSFRLTRARVEIPGAKVVAEGDGALEKGFDIKFGVVITNALALRKVPHALRIVLGINSMLPGRTVEGKITKRPGQKVAFSYHVLPIGVAQLELLFRILTGRVPRFEL